MLLNKENERARNTSNGLGRARAAVQPFLRSGQTVGYGCSSYFRYIVLVPKPARSSGPSTFGDGTTSQTTRGFVRTAITKVIATLSTLLENPATPTVTLENHLAVLEQKHSELVAFDNEIQVTLIDTDLEADMTTTLECQQKVIFAISDVRRATQPRPPTLLVSFAYTARPLAARLPLSPQHAPIRASPYLSTPAPAFSRVVQPTVPRHADVTSSMSGAVPKKLKPAEPCAVLLNSTTVAQPAALARNDDAALLNTCVTSTVQQLMPSIRSSLPAMPDARASTSTPLPAPLPRQAHFFTSSAYFSQSSEPTFAAVSLKIKKDGEKRPHASSGSSKYNSRSHFRNGKGQTSSVSGKSRTMSEISFHKKRRNIRNRHKDGKLHGSKPPSTSKGRQKYRRPPEKLKLSSNVTATSSSSLQLEGPPAPQDKPPPAATPPVATSIAAEQAPHKVVGSLKHILRLRSTHETSTVFTMTPDGTREDSCDLKLCCVTELLPGHV